MKIFVTKGRGIGKTQLSAFDSALYDAGIANFNLVRLSSIIPPARQIISRRINWNDRDFGDKLYVVLSRADQNVIGKEAWAGIGWVQATDGRGLFVEHYTESEEELMRLLKNSLSDMVDYRAGRYGRPKFSTLGIICKEKPVCAIVAAVYESQGWK